MCNHTATHLLQAALIRVLGSHIKQAGSGVGPGRLRFDFTHPEAMTRGQVLEVERLVNGEIEKRTAVASKVMGKEEAVKMGAIAFFGEKYGTQVRVIDVPGFSVELCGGTHVQNTGEIEYFKIISEGSLAAGVRRVEAVTGVGAYEYVDEKLSILGKLEDVLKSKGDGLLASVRQLQDKALAGAKEIKSLKERLQTVRAQDMFRDVAEIDGEMVFKHIDIGSEDDMMKIADLFMDKFSNGIVLITQAKDERLGVLLKTFKSNKNLNCSTVLKKSMDAFDGKGGGKPNMARGSLAVMYKDNFVMDIVDKVAKTASKAAL